MMGARAFTNAAFAIADKTPKDEIQGKRTMLSKLFGKANFSTEYLSEDRRQAPISPHDQLSSIAKPSPITHPLVGGRRRLKPRIETGPFFIPPDQPRTQSSSASLQEEVDGDDASIRSLTSLQKRDDEAQREAKRDLAMASLEGKDSPKYIPLTDREIDDLISTNIKRQDRFVATVVNTTGIFAGSLDAEAAPFNAGDFKTADGNNADSDMAVSAFSRALPINDLDLAIAEHTTRTSAAGAPLENADRDATLGSTDSDLIDLNAALLLPPELALTYPNSTDADRGARVKSTGGSNLIGLDSAILHPTHLPHAFSVPDAANFAADDEDNAFSDITILRTNHTHNPASPNLQSIVVPATPSEDGDIDAADEVALTSSDANSDVDPTAPVNNYNFTSNYLDVAVLNSHEEMNAFERESSDKQSLAGSFAWSNRSFEFAAPNSVKFTEWLNWYTNGNLNVTKPPPVDRLASDFIYLEARPTASEEERTAAGNILDEGLSRLDCTELANILKQIREEFDVKFGAISFFNEDYEVLRAENGYKARLISRPVSLAAHALYTDQPLLIPDTFHDWRFRDNPLVTSGPRIRFFAAVPVTNLRGLVVATLSIWSREPGFMPTRQRKCILEDYALRMQSEITTQMANPNFDELPILHETPDAARVLNTLPNPTSQGRDVINTDAHFPPYRFYRRNPPQNLIKPVPAESTRPSPQATFSMSSISLGSSHMSFHRGDASTERDPPNSRINSPNHRSVHQSSYSIENFLAMTDRDVFENHYESTTLSRNISESTFAPRALTITKTPPVQQEQFRPSVPAASQFMRRSDSSVLEDTKSIRRASVDTSTTFDTLSLTPLLDRDGAYFAEKEARKVARRAGQRSMSASATSSFGVPTSPVGSTDVEKLATAAQACRSACKTFGYDLIYAVELSAPRSNLTDAELFKAGGLTMRVLVAHGMDEVPSLDPKIHLSALRSRGCYNWVAPTPTPTAGFASAKFFAFGKESGPTKDRTDGIVVGALRRAGVTGAVGTSDIEETRDLGEFVAALKGILPRSDRLPRAPVVGSIRGR